VFPNTETVTVVNKLKHLGLLLDTSPKSKLWVITDEKSDEMIARLEDTPQISNNFHRRPCF